MAQPVRVESAVPRQLRRRPTSSTSSSRSSAERYDAKDLATQNLAVYTSLDLPLQTLAQQVLREGLAEVEKMIRRKEQPDPLQGALIALEPSTGAVLALVGGRDYAEQPVQPRHHGPAPAGQHLQAVRLPGRVRGHLRRPRPAAHHARPRWSRTRPPCSSSGGKEYAPAELRGQLQGLRDPADGPRPQPQRGHGQGGGDGGLRPRGEPVEQAAGDAQPACSPTRRWRSARSRPRRWRWPPPTTSWPTAASRSPPVTRAQRRGREGNVACEQHYPRPPRVARPGVHLPRRQHDAQRDQQRHRRRRAVHGLHAPTPRARPAPPTTCATPGSRGSRPTCCAWSGSGFDDNTPIGLCRRARRPLPIWVEFMKGGAGGHARRSGSRPPPPTSSSWTSTSRPACWPRRPARPGHLRVLRRGHRAAGVLLVALGDARTMPYPHALAVALALTGRA